MSEDIVDTLKCGRPEYNEDTRNYETIITKNERLAIKEIARLREELAAVTERMSKLDFERTAVELERDALRKKNELLMQAWNEEKGFLNKYIDKIEHLREENARYKLKYAEYVEATDRMNGTPCEQIRHQQEVEALREENARLEERNKKLNADLIKQAELTAATMTRCSDLMPAQLAVVKLKDQQAEIDALKAEVTRLKGKSK